MKQEDLKFTPDVLRYSDALTATGMDEREVARASLFAAAYGLDALTGDGCVSFKEPSCRNWNCLNPEHQRLAGDA